nr:MAG TPA: Thioredoxin, PSI-II, reduced form, thioredoxin [Caudoviricetes sp.]
MLTGLVKIGGPRGENLHYSDHPTSYSKGHHHDRP